jgi:dethiobiotin synthetase
VTRPHRLVVVTGTGTGIGKTWVAVRVATALAGAGHRVVARKPVQSFAPGDAETDADALAAATDDDRHAVCAPGRWYEVPMAPPMAAEVLGRPPFTIADLVGELVWPEGTDIGLVESAGGPRSPLAHDGDTVDLTLALAPDAVVLVADAGLGTINAVRLAHAPLAAIAPVIVVLNRYEAGDELHARNRAWLADRERLDVVVTAEELAASLAR